MSPQHEKNLEVSYNEELDILTLDRESGHYHRSIVSGDTIVDLSEDGSVRGVEIQNVSRLLGKTPEYLNGISDADMSSSSSDGRVSVTVRISVDGEVSVLAAEVSAPVTA